MSRIRKKTLYLQFSILTEDSTQNYEKSKRNPQIAEFENLEPTKAIE
jgi:hypothetical protein